MIHTYHSIVIAITITTITLHHPSPLAPRPSPLTPQALSIAEFVHIVWRLASLKFTNNDGDMGGHSFSVIEGHANDNLSDALSRFIAESIQPLIQRRSIASMVSTQ